MTTTTTDDIALEIKRVFDATPEQVCEAWLVREEFQAWIGMEGMQCEVPIFEARVGGRYRFVMGMSDGSETPVAGVFTMIEAPKTFAFTWGWEGDASKDSLITVTLREVGGRTELTLRQEGLGTQENRDGHARGWNSTFNKLAVHLVR